MKKKKQFILVYLESRHSTKLMYSNSFPINCLEFHKNSHGSGFSFPGIIALNSISWIPALHHIQNSNPGRLMTHF